jgi:hypothetical protein
VGFSHFQSAGHQSDSEQSADDSDANDGEMDKEDPRSDSPVNADLMRFACGFCLSVINLSPPASTSKTKSGSGKSKEEATLASTEEDERAAAEARRRVLQELVKRRTASRQPFVIAFFL